MSPQFFHAHVYFSKQQIALARIVQANIISALPQLSNVGQLIAMPIGPHTLPMFELHIQAAGIDLAVAKIDALRQDLSVLIHPVQSDELDAHTNSARWLGKPIPLNLDVF